MKKILLLLLLIGVYFPTFGQNGKLISQKPYTIPDSSFVKLEKWIPGIKSAVSQVEFSRITYLSDGLKVNGYMAVPKKAGKYPCVIYNRGGNRDFGKLEDLQIAEMLGKVASWGYVVVASQYRGNDGSEGKEEFGGRDVNDVLNLIPFLTNISKADTSRIGMYGWSRGGMMTYLALTKTNKIKAAIVGAGMADAFMTIQKRPEMDTFVFSELVPGYTENKDSVLKMRSATYLVDKLNKATPLLIMHGSSDWRVSPEEAFKIMQKLYEAKHPVRFVLFEGGDHGLFDYNEEVNYTAKTFLDTYVRDRKKWPNMEKHGN